MIDRPYHDLGGLPAASVPRQEHENVFWEQRVDALMMLLGNAKRPGGPLVRTDQLRRGIESLGAEAYEQMSYYERWISSITQILLENGTIAVDELGRKLAEIERRDA